MATEFDLRIWNTGKDQNAKERFLLLVDTLAQSPHCYNEWSMLSVAQNVPGNIVFEKQEVTDVGQLKEILAPYETEQFNFRIYVPFKCIRFKDKETEESHVMVAVDCWGLEYSKSNMMESSLEGDSKISFLNVGPYCADITEMQNVAQTNANDAVRNNIERQLDLFQYIAKTLSPLKMFVFSNAGEYLLHNVHLAYYSNYKLVSEDLLQYRNILKTGNESYQIPPLTEINLTGNDFFYHEWRTKDLQTEIHARLLGVITKTHPVTFGEHELEKANDRYDTLSEGEKFFILDHPFYMNAFLDEFFIDLLEQ